MFKFDCNNLVHPFQTDPGTSQSQRVMDDLLAGTSKIDGRTIADLLNYFLELSTHIKYSTVNSDSKLIEGDWQQFFKNSIPFTLASASKYDVDTLNEKFQLYCSLFEKQPSVAGLQLIIYYFFCSTIGRINNLYKVLYNSELPVVATLEELIKNKLQQPLTSFIQLSNAAYNLFCIKRPDITCFYENSIWNIQPGIVYTNEKFGAIGSKQEQLIAIYSEIKDMFPDIAETIVVVKEASELSIELSLNPLKEELSKKHTPHLALIFTFLNIFKKLQDDLNGYTKKHLDFFYQNVLQLQPKNAVPDKVHIIFELQKQLKQYALKKGLLVKAGKDDNNAEVDFALDDDIVVNKAQITDLRTLFLNNQSIHNKDYIEGVYMAPAANTADGVEKEFKDDPKNYPTLGAKYSKYIEPGQTVPKPYPYARLGFVLASPVLLLNEGTRTVTITIECKLDDNCSKLAQSLMPTLDPCCKGKTTTPANSEEDFPDFFPSDALFEQIKTKVEGFFIYISPQMIDQAVKLGLNKVQGNDIRDAFLKDDCKKSVCCSDKFFYKEYAIIETEKWNNYLSVNKYFNTPEILSAVFQPRTVFKVLFSGEKDWIEPQSPVTTIISGLSNNFNLTISATLPADKPAVTFYNKDALKEDLGITQPAVKVELDDALKILLQDTSFNVSAVECCLDRAVDLCGREVSLYHFFRNVVILNATIDVKVCGLKNFIVQNDESLQDVNSPVYPFGTRPNVADFDIVNPDPTPKNLIGPNFYIGSQEILCKKWDDVFINLNWKDKPTDFSDYYKGYVKNGLDKNGFQINISVLEEGKWMSEINHLAPFTIALNPVTNDNNRLLFEDDAAISGCVQINPFEQNIYIKNDFFGLNQKFTLANDKLIKYDVNAKNGFLKITLENQDFGHKDYPFVLARQMMAFGKLPNEQVDTAVYYDSTGSPIVFDSSKIKDDIHNAVPIVNRINNDAIKINTKAGPGPGPINATNSNSIRNVLRHNDPIGPNLKVDALAIKKIINDTDAKIADISKFAAIIPNEPWTPIISNISLDYTATAEIADIDLIHLYPYQNTYKHEDITIQPSLLPVFCDEGTLFAGLTDLIPGDTLNILFQFAEATGDSESDPQEVYWQYLDNNQWMDLRPGFEVLDDATENLTTSGIIKFALPENMTIDNTIMPEGLYWIKASVPKNSRAVSETLGIYTQAIEAIFTNNTTNDKNRLSSPLEAGSVSKLQVADANVKQVSQPYPSFNGQVPEENGHYYIRVSELLRHKGRAIQKFDYERLALEAFPQIYKAKCINHSFALNANDYKNDFPFAPGYVILAVIPDLNQLLAGQSFEPKVPAGIIENIKEYIANRVSPFVKIRVMNPRYEKINFCLSVKLIYGKDENYYKEKVAEDIREFLAPWAVGEFNKLTFGQCVNKSDIIGFLETRDYIDYITKLQMYHEFELDSTHDNLEICPATPRSILIAGNIEVCIEDSDSTDWYAVTCSDINLITDYCKNKPL